MATRKLIELTEYHSPDGEVYRFDTQDKFLMSFTGMGMPDMNYITQRGPNQHGASLYDYRLNPRVIQMVHRRNTCSRDAYWDARSDLIDLLRPNRQTATGFTTGTLRKIFSSGDVRDIDVVIERGPTFAPRDTSRWDEWGFTETLRFIAHDPVFYDPTEQSVSWTLSTDEQLVFDTVGNGLNTLVFKKSGVGDGLLFAVGVLSDEENISYDGTWLSFPTIEITGPLMGLIITNETTDEFIRLNYNISAGEVVTITLGYANKTVENDVGNNLIGAVSTDSDLATFHIAPDPEATDGTNVINISGVGADGNTDVALTYYDRYIGI